MQRPQPSEQGGSGLRLGAQHLHRLAANLPHGGIVSVETNDGLHVRASAVSTIQVTVDAIASKVIRTATA